LPLDFLSEGNRHDESLPVSASGLGERAPVSFAGLVVVLFEQTWMGELLEDQAVNLRF